MKPELGDLDVDLAKKSSFTPNSSRKRTKIAAIKTEDTTALPHNLGSIPSYPLDEVSKSARKPRSRASRQITKKEEVDGFDLVGRATATPGSDIKKPKEKNNTYGLTPGQTPYPNWFHPTPAECEEVNRLLSSVHGKVQPPKDIAPPSLTVSGCGEVPSVLDALIRTRLSAATSGTNSSRAFAGLVAKFGILQEGIGKGSVDWNKVRLADTKDVFEAIKSGGLADVKSKDIKKILQMVWEENQTRRQTLLAAAPTPGCSNEVEGEKNAEVTKAQENIVSLDHLHLLSTDEAFNALTKYPGIGPKTASCVLLFCLQRPSFAVDTHVFRLSKWLGWVPPAGDPAGLGPEAKGKFSGPNRNSTYAHLNVRIPDDLKYPLHQLFIKHGKTCPRCRAITGENSEGWSQGCVIDHLVQRTGGRKDVRPIPAKSKSTAAKSHRGKKRKFEEDESDLDSSQLSDIGSEDEKSEFGSD